jgi:hypothetical protein
LSDRHFSQFLMVQVFPKRIIPDIDSHLGACEERNFPDLAVQFLHLPKLYEQSEQSESKHSAISLLRVTGFLP